MKEKSPKGLTPIGLSLRFRVTGTEPSQIQYQPFGLICQYLNVRSRFPKIAIAGLTAPGTGNSSTSVKQDRRRVNRITRLSQKNRPQGVVRRSGSNADGARPTSMKRTKVDFLLALGSLCLRGLNPKHISTTLDKAILRRRVNAQINPWLNSLLHPEMGAVSHQLEKDPYSQKETRKEAPGTIPQVPLQILKDNLMYPLNQEAFDEFDEYRQSTGTAKQKKAWSDLAKRKAKKILQKLTPDSQQSCVDHSIVGGYQGLFPERFERGQTQRQNSSSRFDAAFAAAFQSPHRGPIPISEGPVRQPLDFAVSDRGVHQVGHGGMGQGPGGYFGQADRARDEEHPDGVATECPRVPPELLRQ